MDKNANHIFGPGWFRISGKIGITINKQSQRICKAGLVHFQGRVTSPRSAGFLKVLHTHQHPFIRFRSGEELGNCHDLRIGHCASAIIGDISCGIIRDNFCFAIILSNGADNRITVPLGNGGSTGAAFIQINSAGCILNIDLKVCSTEYTTGNGSNTG